MAKLMISAFGFFNNPLLRIAYGISMAQQGHFLATFILAHRTAWPIRLSLALCCGDFEYLENQRYGKKILAIICFQG